MIDFKKLQVQVFTSPKKKWWTWTLTETIYYLKAVTGLSENQEIWPGDTEPICISFNADCYYKTQLCVLPNVALVIFSFVHGNDAYLFSFTRELVKLTQVFVIPIMLIKTAWKILCFSFSAGKSASCQLTDYKSIFF